MKRRSVLALCGAVLLAMLVGCGTTTRHPRVSEEDLAREAALQQHLAIEAELSRRARVMDVVYRLSRAASSECAGGQPLTGVELGGAGLLQKPYRDTGAKLGLSDAVRVLAVAAQSPANAAGIRPGDVLIRINSKSLRSGIYAYRDATFNLREALQAGPASLEFQRDGHPYSVQLMAERGCETDYFITRELLPTPKANGRAVLLPVSFVRLVRDDDTLAGVVAFLMAYNIKGHGESFDGVARTDVRNLKALIGEDETQLFQPPQALDYVGVREADAYSLELARRAGYDPVRLVRAWRTYLVNTPALTEDIQWGRALTGVTRLSRLHSILSATP